MKEILYWLVQGISVFHDYIMKLNDSCETSFTDKELHFIVIAIIGMLLLFVIYPLFKT